LVTSVTDLNWPNSGEDDDVEQRAFLHITFAEGIFRQKQILALKPLVYPIEFSPCDFIIFIKLQLSNNRRGSGYRRLTTRPLYGFKPFKLHSQLTLQKWKKISWRMGVRFQGPRSTVPQIYIREPSLLFTNKHYIFRPKKVIVRWNTQTKKILSPY
jgi:hypothetical protein